MFVTRRAYDDAQATITRLLNALDTERGRYSQLVKDMAAMQRQGFRAPDPALEVPPATPRLPPAVLAAITTTMNPRGEAARQTAELAQAWLEQGAPVETVCQRIRQGAEGQKGPPDDDAAD